jgi:type I restriction enzyme, S subunit
MTKTDIHTETKPGYKKTKLGLLPEEWELKKLGKLFEFRNGVNASKEDYGKGIKFVNVMDVLENTFITEGKILGSVQLTEKQIERNLVKKGDVLFNRTSETQDEIGLTALYNDDAEAVFGGFVIRGRPKNNTLNHQYNGYSFQSELVRKQIISKGQGAVRVNIGQSDLEKVLFPLPPLHEQKKIAEILSTWDCAIETLEQLIAKKEELKKGLMQQLLTGKKRFPGFDGEWKKLKTGKLFDFLRSISVSRKDLDENNSEESVLNLHYGDLHVKYNSMTMLDVGNSNDIPSIVNGYNYPSNIDYAKDGDVIIVDASEDYEGVGECVELNNVGVKKLTAGLHTFLLRDKLYLTVEGFRSLIFEQPKVKKQLKRLVTGSNVFGLSKSNLAKVEVDLPSEEEQRKIVETLQGIESEIGLLIVMRDNFEFQKKGLMQQLLRGKTRVKI